MTDRSRMHRVTPDAMPEVADEIQKIHFPLRELLTVIGYDEGPFDFWFALDAKTEPIMGDRDAIRDWQRPIPIIGYAVDLQVPFWVNETVEHLDILSSWICLGAMRNDEFSLFGWLRDEAKVRGRA